MPPAETEQGKALLFASVPIVNKFSLCSLFSVAFFAFNLFFFLVGGSFAV